MEAWRALLAAGDTQAAWDTFITRYRRLIIATIRRSAIDSENAAEIFADICGELSSDDLAVLRRHDDAGRARFSTWLVSVVHHRTVDSVRREYGRRRVSIPSGLSELQEKIFQHVFVARESHVEAYEMIRQTMEGELPFRMFLHEVAATYRVLQRVHGKAATHYLSGPPVSLEENENNTEKELYSAESGSQLASALDMLRTDERAAVKLFVIDEMPASKVASIVGWPNAKTVYNRVYRALAQLRKELERRGFDRVSSEA